MTYRSYLVDTGAWLAWYNDGDDWSSIVRAIIQELTESSVKLITTDLVVYEFITRLRTQKTKQIDTKTVERYVAEILETCEVLLLTADSISQVLRVVNEFSQLPLSSCDASSIGLMRERGINAIITTDSHFMKCGLFPEVRPNLVERGGRY